MKIARKRKNRVEKAFDVLTRYCGRTTDCEYCRFYDEEKFDGCLFSIGLCPNNWTDARSKEK